MPPGHPNVCLRFLSRWWQRSPSPAVPGAQDSALHQPLVAPFLISAAPENQGTACDPPGRSAGMEARRRISLPACICTTREHRHRRMWADIPMHRETTTLMGSAAQTAMKSGLWPLHAEGHHLCFTKHSGAHKSKRIICRSIPLPGRSVHKPISFLSSLLHASITHRSPG